MMNGHSIEDTNNNSATTVIDQIKSAIDQDDIELLAVALEDLDIEEQLIHISNRGKGRDLHPLFYASYKGAINCLQYLIEEKNVDISLRDRDGSIFLHWLKNEPEGIVTYAENRLDINAVNKFNCTPLYIAAGKGRLLATEQLLRGKAYVDRADDMKQTPLHRASEEGHPGVVDTLIRYEAKVDLFNDIGRTPLHLAAQEGHFHVVRSLIKAGAKVDLLTEDGLSPLYIAAHAFHFTAVRALLERGAEIKDNLLNLNNPSIKACIEVAMLTDKFLTGEQLDSKNYDKIMSDFDKLGGDMQVAMTSIVTLRVSSFITNTIKPTSGDFQDTAMSRFRDDLDKFAVEEYYSLKSSQKLTNKDCFNIAINAATWVRKEVVLYRNNRDNDLNDRATDSNEDEAQDVSNDVTLIAGDSNQETLIDLIGEDLAI